LTETEGIVDPKAETDTCSYNEEIMNLRIYLSLFLSLFFSLSSHPTSGVMRIWNNESLIEIDSK